MHGKCLYDTYLFHLEVLLIELDFEFTVKVAEFSLIEFTILPEKVLL